MNVIDFLDKGHSLGPEVACVVEGARSLSYGEVVARTHRLAAAAARDGFGPGAKFAVLSPNDIDAFVAVLGGLRAQLVWLPINPRYAMTDITALLERFDCALLIVHPSFADDIAFIRAQVSSISAVVSLGPALPGAVAMADWQAEEGARHDPPPAAPDDVVAIMATGGTTGLPKGVMQTHRGFATYVANHMLTMWQLVCPRYLVAAPMTHAAGFMCFPMLARGGTIFVLEGAKPRAVAEAIRDHAITDLFLPPTVIYMMLADPEIRAMRFPSLRYLLYGAAPMSVERLREALEWLGPVLVHGFGQVEALMLCTALRPEEHYQDGQIASDQRLSSCGRATPLAMLAVMAEDGRLLPDEETGELVVRGGHVMKGYYKNPEATAEAGRFGWHHTGDIGYRDAEGFYHLVDRAKDMIISGGYNIYPSEIEQLLWTHPAVQDCAVIGAPDAKWGEAVTAVVQLKPGATAEAAELIGLCRVRLGPLKAPKAVEFWPDLPRSPVGKVLKRAIRDRFWTDVQRRI